MGTPAVDVSILGSTCADELAPIRAAVAFALTGVPMVETACVTILARSPRPVEACATSAEALGSNAAQSYANRLVDL